MKRKMLYISGGAIIGIFVALLFVLLGVMLAFAQLPGGSGLLFLVFYFVLPFLSVIIGGYKGYRYSLSEKYPVNFVRLAVTCACLLGAFALIEGVAFLATTGTF